ncbi:MULTISPECIES: type III-B CRISPR module RAMP protein Cmr6 [Dolichospermum]|uniref:Cmr6 family CRISPR-associated RAMP protein n=1 Tax=Dolichospermum compactum NIES-806 TaxID=1973481 RepID=A0A1Z4V6U6_9CYAN|nr:MULTISPECIES: type III-B CRISPR module RAMP protein Cmr6 [Dolichospermum]MBE9247697.1 type III-B CRISPR module RAMP protein Cmr6 [Dolichospermum sp. LEGE 00240]BAZ87164.1 Cmr6 family CRISPR-associated RAMP protein [Dolichospermum compactum NIES-806]
MVFERPQTNQPRRPQPPAPTTPDVNRPRKVINVPVGDNGRGNGNPGGHGGGNNQPPIPSPWLNPDNPPQPHPEASFVEYLRWMRTACSSASLSPNHDYKDSTKVQILQMAEQGSKYSQRLQQLTKRTELIAQKSFKVQCPWRIRVGGHRGPESILLPAFDALGIPYIPSSSLRGVARTQAIREIMAKDKIEWQEAEKQIASYFGSVETQDKANQAGKVVFLDAYPLPNQNQNVLAVDIANNIWQWDNNSANNTPKYSPNPNPFFSLEKPMFVIGLRLASNCQDNDILEQVKQWLIKGLQAGVGSQVNTGYGQLNPAGKLEKNHEFFRVEFVIEGQLIHGRQRFRNVNQPYQRGNDGRFRTDNNGKLRTDNIATSEVRPVAFKSMLRYWFRTFALGVLEPTQVQEWENKIFGGINPSKQYGWLMVRVLEGKTIRDNATNQNDDFGEQSGILTLNYSPEIPQSQKQNLEKLIKNLTWLMFHLGGIGQGARRPLYSRKNRNPPRPPWYRGCNLITESDDNFWTLPDNTKQFQELFKTKIRNFYEALQTLGVNFNSGQLRTCGIVRNNQWTEAIDANCRIFVCSGDEKFGKSYALSVLHSDELKFNNNYDGNLCGKTQGNKVIPSPVWIANLGNYQVVTVFGANENPRRKYLETLQSKVQIFPL